MLDQLKEFPREMQLKMVEGNYADENETFLKENFQWQLRNECLVQILNLINEC